MSEIKLDNSSIICGLLHDTVEDTSATIGEIKVTGGSDFTIYSGGNGMVKILDPVWAGERKPEQAMEELGNFWQGLLDKG